MARVRVRALASCVVAGWERSVPDGLLAREQNLQQKNQDQESSAELIRNLGYAAKIQAQEIFQYMAGI